MCPEFEVVLQPGERDHHGEVVKEANIKKVYAKGDVNVGYDSITVADAAAAVALRSLLPAYSISIAPDENGDVYNESGEQIGENGSLSLYPAKFSVITG